MKVVEFKNTEDFISFLRANIANEKIKELIPIIDHFNGINQGCGCKRNERANIFNSYYENKIINIQIEIANEIKSIVNGDKLIFYKNNQNEILKEF